MGMQLGEDRSEQGSLEPGWKDEKACPEGQEGLFVPDGDGSGAVCDLPGDPREAPCAPPRKISRWQVLKAVALSALGYGYVLTLLCVLSGLLYRIITFIAGSPDPLVIFIICSPALLAAAILLAGTLRAVWIRTQPPEGFEIIQVDAPGLFEALDLIRTEIRGPKISRVLLTGDFDASIARMPRLGVFGWHRNELVLGLPLLQALSPGEMLAVLAHEYGHLSRANGRLRSWVCEARKSWMQVLQRIEQGKGRFLLRRFVRWYAPYLHAATLELARSREYEADLCSTGIAGREQAAAALIRLEVIARFLRESFWPSVSAMMDTRPDPVQSVYGLMQERFRQGIEESTAREWIELALAGEADRDAAHPCLRERLEAMGGVPDLPPAPARSAAEHYFPYLDDVRKWLDDEWRSLIRTQWQERYEHARKAGTRLAELVAEARLKPLSAGETLELAALIEDLSGHDKAFPYYQRILEYMPRCVPALCAVGRIKLAKGDESGVGYIEQAIALDPKYRICGLQALYDFYVARGDLEKTGKYFQELSEQRASQERARQERKPRRLPARYMVSRRKTGGGGTPPHA